MPGNTKRRRRKHKGTQTGSISRQARSRPRNRQEAMAQAKSRRSTGAKGGRRAGPKVDRRDMPPTWKGAATRGVLFAALLLPVSLLFGQPLAGAIVLTVIAACLYVPLGFYTEQFFYNRRRARMQSEREQRRNGKVD